MEYKPVKTAAAAVKEEEEVTEKKSVLQHTCGKENEKPSLKHTCGKEEKVTQKVRSQIPPPFPENFYFPAAC